MGESPIQRIGDGKYDGASANGWHVVLRRDDGELESLSGPWETPNEAATEYARLVAR